MSKWTDEVFNKEVQHSDAALFDDHDGADTSLKVFPANTPKHLSIGAWWDGNSGEWTPEYLTVDLDRADVQDLIDTLSTWMEKTK